MAFLMILKHDQHDAFLNSYFSSALVIRITFESNRSVFSRLFIYSNKNLAIQFPESKLEN